MEALALNAVNETQPVWMIPGELTLEGSLILRKSDTLEPDKILCEDNTLFRGIRQERRKGSLGIVGYSGMSLEEM